MFRHKFLVAAALLSLAVLASSATASLRSLHASPSMPVELRGIWRTDNAKYRDRYLDLDEHFLVFGTGEDEHPNVQRIERIDTLAGARSTAYTVYAKDIEGSELKLNFEYTSANGGEVRLTNPKNVVWKRTPSE